jgi:hypothetical protein
MRFVTKAFKLLFVCTLVAASAANAAQLSLDVRPDAPATEVALLTINAPQERGRDFECVIVALASDGIESGVLPDGVVAAAIKPGRYNVTAGYRTHLKGGQAVVEKMFEAGARYEVACVGKTYNQLRIRVNRVDG